MLGASAGDRLVQLYQAMLQELAAIAQHVCTDLLGRRVELTRKGLHRRPYTRRFPQYLEEAPAGLVHAVVVSGLDVEEDGLGRERAMDHLMGDQSAARPDEIPYQRGIQSRLLSGASGKALTNALTEQ